MHDSIGIVTPRGVVYARVGEKFIDEIMRVSRESGLYIFEVYVNGDKISREEVPEVIEKGMRIVLKRWDPETRTKTVKNRSIKKVTKEKIIRKSLSSLTGELRKIDTKIGDISSRWGIK